MSGKYYFLSEGRVGSCVDFATGSRQRSRSISGDMLGTPSVVLDSAAETLIG